MSQIKLGSKVRDKVSGFAGVVTARTEYLYTTPSVCVKPESTKDGKLIDAVWFDESQVEIESDKPRTGYAPP